jgi:hypothetical protein
MSSAPSGWAIGASMRASAARMLVICWWPWAVSWMSTERLWARSAGATLAVPRGQARSLPALRGSPQTERVLALRE